MYRIILSCTLFLCITVSYSFSQITINPQVGVHSASFKRELNSGIEDLKTRSKVGYQLGVLIRTGGPIYLESGAVLASVNQQYYFEIKPDIPVRPGPGLIRDFANHLSLQVPLRVGYTIGKERFKVRTAVGPVLGYNFNTPSKNDVAPSIGADFNAFLLAGKIGLGFDIAFVTFDLDYQVGINRTFEEDFSGRFPLPRSIYGNQTRNNTLFITTGIKL